MIIDILIKKLNLHVVLKSRLKYVLHLNSYFSIIYIMNILFLKKSLDLWTNRFLIDSHIDWEYSTGYLK